jgi:Domain of unknown function (DUF4136)
MIRWLSVCALAMAMAGCAGLNRVDNTVQSFARWEAIPTGGASAGPIPQGPQRYRFERLPSQGDGAAGAAQTQLEALARSALQAHGWTAADDGAPARWTVQVSATSVRTGRDPWNDPWGGWPLRGHFVAGHGHVFFAPMFVVPMDSPSHRRQVTVLVREAATGRLVYETRADHESAWNGTSALWQAMIEAALRDFPAPPAGPRQVQVELPR